MIYFLLLSNLNTYTHKAKSLYGSLPVISRLAFPALFYCHSQVNSIGLKTARPFYIVTICLFAISCRKDPSLRDGTTLNGGPVAVFGHAGMGSGSKYPMDSYESLSKCLELGADGTEMDVQLSADTVLVLCHATGLNELTDCSGKIRDQTWDQLKNCIYCRPLRSEKIKLCSAEDFFNKVNRKPSHVFTIECKLEAEESPEFVARFARAVIRLVEKYNLESNCYIESYNISFLKKLNQHNPRLKLFIYADDYPTALSARTEVPLCGLTIDLYKITAPEIREAHKQGLQVTLFNTRTASANVKALGMSPDNIQTDKLEHLLKIRKE